MRLALLTVAIVSPALLLAVCTAQPTPTPTTEFTATTTPNLDATIAAAIETTTQTRPTPNPTAALTPIPIPTSIPTAAYWPTYMDFDLIAHQQFIDISAVLYQATHKSYPTIVAIYVARECFDGNPLTPEGFRSFVDQTLVSDYLGGVNLETVLAQELIGKMVALRGKQVEGSCMEPFLRPKSGAEAALGQALVPPQEG